MEINRILIANRGEIAVRIARACYEMDITSVAVFSEADRSAKHVRYADEAYEIGPPPSGQSYLVIEKIIETAVMSNCQAIHPGYGFLAENPLLPAACEKAGLIFIGPSHQAMALLGNKTEARKLMKKSGIPIIPGVMEPLATTDEAISAAEIIGYPVLLKATAGGGGKGVRVVESPDKLRSAFERAQAEALSAFGNPDIYLEKYLVKPRHIEMQILADEHGNIIHLNERECSVQRRYQKLVEESPSCIVDEDMRRKMGEAAVEAIRVSGYTNAGTVEFLVDSSREFFFLEVNARLQVEHPVTELITGVDLVKEQIRIASGERLSLKQTDIGINGAAIECRISAEDPETFLPSVGLIRELIEPAGPGIRVESGIAEEYDVPVYYDPLLSKVITWGKDREEAIARMLRALNEYKIKGVKTTIPFHRRVLVNKAFRSGNYDTGIVPQIEHTETKDYLEIAAIAAAIVAMTDEQVKFTSAAQKAEGWKLSGRIYGGIRSIGW
ncbi:MAG: acetyl-CoA carboxylase biotin carboxylase subunit, partial [Candidatus Aegiribacteria sp.]|nr:acetyl-CoA carboxylase biotin carboxylase subunit [Candidatus Aegiribacteria sp.]